MGATLDFFDLELEERLEVRDIILDCLKEQKQTGEPFEFYSPKFDTHVRFDGTKIIICYGSRNSGKSYNIGLKMLELAEDEEHYFRGVVLRKTLKAHRKSTWKLLNDIIKSTNRSDKYAIHKSDLTITCKATGNEIHFVGLDDPEKVKGTADPTFLWFEEPNTDGVTKKDFITASTSMRGKNYKYKQIVFSMNSDDDEHWIKELYFPEGLGFENELPRNPIVNSPKKDVKIVHFTYKDNIFADRDDIESLEELENIDEDLYKVYALGLFGGKTKGKIYSNYMDIDNYDDIPTDYIAYGVDWGYNNPCALIECKVYDGDLYFRQRIYGSGIDPYDEFIPSIMEIVGDYKTSIYADPSEPQYIDKVFEYMFNISGGDNAKMAGIAKVRAFPKIYICRQSKDLLRELKLYKWKYDAKRDKFLDVPEDKDNHALDALRYIVNTDPIIESIIYQRGLDKLMKKGVMD